MMPRLHFHWPLKILTSNLGEGTSLTVASSLATTTVSLPEKVLATCTQRKGLSGAYKNALHKCRTALLDPYDALQRDLYPPRQQVPPVSSVSKAPAHSIGRSNNCTQSEFTHSSLPAIQLAPAGGFSNLLDQKTIRGPRAHASLARLWLQYTCCEIYDVSTFMTHIVRN